MKRNPVVKGLLWMLIFSAPYHSIAQSIYTLQDAWEQVLQQYPGILSKQAHLHSIKIDSTLLQSKYLPKIQSQYQHAYGTFQGSNGAFFPQSGFFNTSGSPHPNEGAHQTFNHFGSVTADWELIHFGRKKLEKTISGLEIKKAYQDYESYLIDLKSDLSERYLRVLFEQAFLGWTKRNAHRLLEILNITQSLSLSGMRPIADTLMASASYLQVLAQQDQYLGAFRASEQYLKAYTSLAIHKDSTSIKTFLNIPKSRVGATGQDHPSLQAARIKQQIWQNQLQLIRQQQWPRMALLGGISTRSSGIHGNGVASQHWKDGWKNRANNYLLGVGITWNVTQMFVLPQLKKQALIQASAAQFDVAEKALQQATSQSAVEMQLEESQQQLIKSITSVQKAAEAYEMYVARYEAGLMDLGALLQTQVLLQETEKKHIENSYAFWQQRIRAAAVSGDFNDLFNQL